MSFLTAGSHQQALKPRSPNNLSPTLSQYLYLYLAPSRMAGIGLFTARAWAKGSEILRVEDPDYFAPAQSHAQLQALGYTHADVFQVGPDLFIPPHGSPDDFTNHSCEPNCGLRVSRSGFTMIALTDIAAFEELTYDYSTHQEHPLEDMPCACGAVSCRGVVRSFSTLPKVLRDFYVKLGVVGDFVGGVDD